MNGFSMLGRAAVACISVLELLRLVSVIHYRAPSWIVSFLVLIECQLCHSAHSHSRGSITVHRAGDINGLYLPLVVQFPLLNL